VVRQDPTTQQLTLQLSTGTKRQAEVWEVAEQKPAAKAAMSEKLDFRKLTKLQKEQAFLMAGSSAEQTASQQMLGGLELSMG
jgi:hypothetical protein